MSVSAAGSSALIRLQAVGKSFGSFKALDRVDLAVGSGEKIVICGPSGSGKSTLIRCISQLETHDEGQIWVDAV
ncbi:MAG: ATP-binding cassette domain-containing protein, partial [Betaproteobacteria bacterium]